MTGYNSEKNSLTFHSYLLLFISLLKPIKIGESYKHIWFRNFIQFKKNFVVSLFWVILEPLMYLGAIGFGLGSFVNNIHGQSYVDFFFPGLLCSTAMMVPFFEGTYSNYTKLTYQKIYSQVLLTQISPEEIIFGEILWAMSKGFFGVCGVSFVALFFGLIQDWKFIFVLLVLLLTSFLFSAIAMFITSLAKNYDSFIYATSGFIIPMTLISGIYFPTQEMNLIFKVIAYIAPLTHSVELSRTLLHGEITWSFGVSLFYLLGLSYLFLNLSIKRISAKLIS